MMHYVDALQVHLDQLTVEEVSFQLLHLRLRQACEAIDFGEEVHTVDAGSEPEDVPSLQDNTNLNKTTS